MSHRTGVPLSTRPMFLMARNLMPETFCMECGEPATHFCMECMYEEESWTLCEQHARIHPHDEDGEPIELVNSPRLGLCGYEGPADPPY